MVKQNLNYLFKIIEMFSMDKEVTSCRKKDRFNSFWANSDYFLNTSVRSSMKTWLMQILIFISDLLLSSLGSRRALH